MINFQIVFNQFNSFLVCLAAYNVLSQRVGGGGERIEHGRINNQQPGWIRHARKPSTDRVKPTQFQGQIGQQFGTDLYFMEIYRIAIMISQCSAFLKKKLTVVVFFPMVNNLTSTITFVY